MEKYTKLKTKDLIKVYNNGNSELKSTLKDLYPKVSFERLLPKTWEEYCDIKGYNYIDVDVYIRVIIIENESSICFDSFIDLSFDANKFKYEFIKDDKLTAINKLRYLRDYYNDGWKPDWEDGTVKKTIERYNNAIRAYDSYHDHIYFSFKNSLLRDNFLQNFKELIIEADYLI